MNTTTFDRLTRSLGSGLTRRAALRGLVASALAGVAGRSAAGVAEADNKTGDFGSQEWFQRYCEEIAGGTFIDDGLGNLECRMPAGDWIECDEVGRDCWYIDPPRRKAPKGDLGNGGGNNGGRDKK